MMSPLQDRDPLSKIEAELAASAISPEIAAQHFRYIEGDEAIELIAGELLEQVGGHGQQYATVEVGRILKRYECLRDGGWAFQGLDPLADFEPMAWQVFKPFRPRHNAQKDKPIKYESPAGIPTRVFIAGDPDDWLHWQGNPSVPIAITEGCKKSSAAQSYGIPTIGLSGIWNGSKKDEKGIHHLIPELLAFCVPGRLWRIDFDCDTKAKTREQVAKAIGVLARLLEEQGQQVAIVRRDSWGHKGTDDFIAAEGIQAYRGVLEAAEPLERWKARQHHRKSTRLNSNRTEGIPSLENFDIGGIPQSGVVGIRAAKGQGKTKMLARLLEGESQVVALSHRVSLGRSLSGRLELTWQTDRQTISGRAYDINRQGRTTRMGSTVDSLLGLPLSAVEGGILVLDEADQILRHLIKSSTIRKRRGRTIQKFRQMVESARLVICASADLSQGDMNYLTSIRGEQPWILENRHTPMGAPTTMIQSGDPSSLVMEVLEMDRQGKRLYIATDSRQMVEKLHLLLSVTSPVLDITSRTSGGDEQRELLENPDTWLTANPRHHVIASPSLGSGVSIEGSHFDAVIGFFSGCSITASDAAQALGRVRQPIPRLVWAARGRGAVEGSNPIQIAGDEHTRLRASSQLLRAEHQEILKAFGQGSPEFHLWTSYTAEANWSKANFRSDLHVRLEHEGSLMATEERERDPVGVELLTEAAQKLKRLDAERVSRARKIDWEEAKELESSHWRKPEDADALTRYHLREFYISDVIPELVMADANGRRREYLRRMEGLAFVDICKRYDQAIAGSLVPELPTIWDLPHSTLEQQVMEAIGLGEFLAWAMTGVTWGKDSPEVQAVVDKARANPEGIRQGLRLTIRPTMTNCQIIGELLHRLGLKTIPFRKWIPVDPPPQLEGAKDRGGSSKKLRAIRVYGLDMQHLAEVQKILQRRHERRQASENGIPDADLPDTVLARWIFSGILPDQPRDPPDILLISSRKDPPETDGAG